jgi:putative acyl-CoA dehydrogenase
MECHGGVGYVEDTPMPRLFRESPVNGIWEGSGNVIALDVLRTLRREPGALDAFAAELAAAAGADRVFDAAVRGFERQLATAPEEADGRQVVERMAVLLQASLLLRHAPAAVADAFCSTRLGEGGGRLFGVLPRGTDVGAILGRQGA